MAGRTRTARLFVRVSPAPAHSQHDNRPFVNRRVLLLLLAFTVVPTNKRESRNLGRPLRVLISFPLLSLLRILFFVKKEEEEEERYFMEVLVREQ